MTNLEKLIEVFGCTVRYSNDTIVDIDLDGTTAFFRSWADAEYKEPIKCETECEHDMRELRLELKSMMEQYYVVNCKKISDINDRLNEIERSMSKCWNRIGKNEQKVRESIVDIKDELNSCERKLNSLLPPLKEQTEEEFLKALRSIKVVRIQ